MVVPSLWRKSYSSAVGGLLQFVVDDGLHIWVAFEGVNFFPGLTIERALQIVWFDPLIMISTASLSGYLSDKLALAAKVYLNPLIGVIGTRAPRAGTDVWLVVKASSIVAVLSVPASRWSYSCSECDGSCNWYILINGFMLLGHRIDIDGKGSDDDCCECLEHFVFLLINLRIYERFYNN